MKVVMTLALVAGVHLAATAVPGPTTFVVVRSALGRSRRASVAAAAGVMVADTGWALAAMGGISLVFARFPWLHRTLGVAGGAYLLLVAVRTWRAARHEPAEEASRRAGRRSAFASGAVTNAMNPKSVVFFGSIFAAALPPGTAIGVRLGAVAVVAFNALWWHVALGFVFSLPRAHQLYSPLKPVLDRATAGILGFFGAVLLSEAR